MTDIIPYKKLLDLGGLVTVYNPPILNVDVTETTAYFILSPKEKVICFKFSL